MTKLNKNDIIKLRDKLVEKEVFDMTVERLRVSEDTYKRLYDEQKDKIEYLEGFIGDSTVEKIKADKEKIETLSNRVTQQDKEIAVLSNTVKEKDNTISLLREQRDKEIREAEDRIKIQLERSKGAEIREAVKSAKSNEAFKIRQNEVKPLKAQYEALLEHIGETTDRTDKNVLGLIELVTNGFNKIEQLISKGGTQEEIKEAVEEVKRDTISKISKDDIVEECKEIHRLLSEGKTQKEIANLMYPDLNRRETKVSERIKSKTYQKLFNDEN